jgi:hypothetical protein
MQQTGQIHPRAERWRRTSSVARFGSAMGWTTARVPKACGMPVSKNAGAAGAVFRPAVPHAPFGEKEQG